MTQAHDAPAGRRPHWLELFFDLVMVVYISQVAHTLHGDPSWADAGLFFGLLAASWWAWVNATLTMNLFGLRITPSIWITVTIAMVALGGMAAAAPDVLGERAAVFAIANAAIRVVWVVPWLMSRRASGQPWWQPVLYSILPASLWLVSIVVSPPWQYVLWGAAIAVEIVMLSALDSRRDWLSDNLDVDHLSERVGLLIVIVFGESILTIISELDEHWTAPSGLVAVLGFAAVSMLAWIFFGRASAAATEGLRRLQLRRSVGGIRDTVMYLPFLMVAGVTLFASALGTAVADAGHELPLGAAVCLAGGISLFFVASAAETVRYGARWRDVLLWASAGIALPWVLVPIAGAASAEVVVSVAVAVIAALVVLTEVDVRRVRTLTVER